MPKRGRDAASQAGCWTKGRDTARTKALSNHTYQALGKPFQPTSLIAASPASRCNCIGFTTLMRLY